MIAHVLLILQKVIQWQYQISRIKAIKANQ